MNELEFNPAVTAIRRRKLSAPVAWLIKHHYLRSGKSLILDYGCGYGSDVRLLRDWNKGKPVIGYDKYHYDSDINKGFLIMTFDVVLCTYVLNVVDEEEEFEIIHKMWANTRANGHLFITVRRDIDKGTTTYKHSDGTWHLQRFVMLDEKYFHCINSNSKFAIYHASEDDVTKYLYEYEEALAMEGGLHD